MDERITESWLAEIEQALGGDEPVDRELPISGRLYLDRRLPFVCVYRRPPKRVDPQTSRLVTTQASYLLAPGNEAFHGDVDRLLERLGSALSRRHGGFLALELWSAPDRGEPEDGAPASLRPGFRLIAPDGHRLAATRAAMLAALEEIVVHKLGARVASSAHDAPAPPEMKPLLSHTPRSEIGRRSFVLGLEVSPSYRDARTGGTYPFVFHQLRASLDLALRKTFFAFLRHETRLTPTHVRSLGRRHLQEVTLEVDHELAELEETVQFLLQSTPLDATEAWESFRAGDFREAPSFSYRPLPLDPELFKRKLFRLPIERVEDSSLAEIFREKQEELDRQVTMLRGRESRHFFFGSLQLYGEVDDELYDLARCLLDRLTEAPGDGDGRVGADELCRGARREFDHYARACPSFPRSVELRSDIAAGVMVARGRLLVSPRIRVTASRVHALLQHEVGTHMLTYHNGAAQPLRLFKTGLAGYEELQEGLAVVAEYLAGGLNRRRLRTLAARVVAARRLSEGVCFERVFAELHERHRLDADVAFRTTMRAFRGGGLAKDAVYLRGLRNLLTYLRRDGSLEPLLVGKIALRHVDLVDELRDRGVLREPVLRPRYLEHPEGRLRLERLRGGRSMLELVEETSEAVP